MPISRSVLAAFFLAAYLDGLGQLAQANRFEIHLRDGQTEPYKISSLQEKGLLLYGNIIADGDEAIEVIRVDTTLKEVWKGFIKIDRRLVLIYSEPKEDLIYLLLRDRFQAQGDFQIIALQINDGYYSTYPVKNLIPFNPTLFVITKEAALIGGYFNYRPLVLHYNFQKQLSKILPGFFNEPGEINQIKETSTGGVDVVVSAKNFSRRKCLWIRNYNAEGDLVKTIVLQPDENKNLIFGRSIQAPGGDQVVSGVYGRYTDYSRGIFLANIDQFGEYKINYYNFGELEHFFNYMKVKREKRVKERIERRKIKGKKIRFNYRVLVEELIPYGDQFVMLGEAFYPHYSYSTRSMGAAMYSSRFYGTPLTRNDLIFDGYQYTHAVVIGFDKDGKLTWDNSFEINDVRTFQLEQYVKIRTQENRIVLLYLFENVVRSKIIKDSRILEGKTYDALKMSFRDDVVVHKDTEKSKLDYWYKNVFYATGIQQLRNLRDSGIDIHRRVFFINKIDYK